MKNRMTAVMIGVALTTMVGVTCVLTLVLSLRHAKMVLVVKQLLMKQSVYQVRHLKIGVTDVEIDYIRLSILSIKSYSFFSFRFED